MRLPTVLLTGATGYIGSHTWLALLAAGYAVIGTDDFSNSSPNVLPRMRQLSGREPSFERVDIRDATAVERVFAGNDIAAVVHFAAFKAVGESTAQLRVARGVALKREEIRARLAENHHLGT